MKVLAKGLKWLAIIILVLIIGLYATGNGYILKGIRVVYMTGHTTAFIDDHPYFTNRTIETATPQVWEKDKGYNTLEPTERLLKINAKYGTVAFLIIKNGKILYENYAEGYDEKSKTNSFSMAKSITTSLLFKAIQDGYIKSLDQPLTDFFPDFKGEFASKCTVGDLSSMSSGLSWNENYTSPFSITAQAYYDENIRELIQTLEISEEPGKSFKYLSGSTQLLGMVIEKATKKSLSAYLSQSFWKPLGMNDFGLWQLDEEGGMEKTYCCVSTNARNYAKFGQLYLQKGNWKGRQIIDSSFVDLATKPRFKASPEYGYGFWLSDYMDKDVFAMRGILGQYVIAIPEDNLVIVRLGHQRDAEKVNAIPIDFYMYIDEVYRMLASESIGLSSYQSLNSFSVW
jgi:CubicO group peptidase (beta-lactamase class C family)